MKKEKKVETVITVEVEGQMIRQYKGFCKVKEYELIADVINTLWIEGMSDETDADKKAIKSIKEVMKIWDKEMLEQ